MACPTGVGESYRPWLVPLRSFWHIYKQATKDIYRLASGHFLAPLFHHFHPDKRFWIEPKHRNATYILSLVRLSYPAWRAELDALLAMPLREQERGHAENLKLPAEYFSPLVLIRVMYVVELIVRFCRRPKRNYPAVKLRVDNFEDEPYPVCV